MMLEDLGQYLQSEGLGTLGTDLFLGGIPLDAPNVVQVDEIAALVETPGFPAQYVHDILEPSVEYPVIQLLVRGKPYDYATPRLRAQEILLALGKIHNQTLSGTFYFWCIPLHSPWKLSDDDFSRPLMSCQFRCAKSV
jgi:hypothetical protein